MTARIEPSDRSATGIKIGIVGGGLTGLALAHRLSQKGHAVSVFERDKQLGGLSTYHDYGQFVWDRFYHCILPTDTYLIGFLKEIGLGDQLCWTQTQTGFYVDQQFYPMTTGLDFLRFPLVSLWGKVRLALMILYCSRINNWQPLEKVLVEDWLIKACGSATYEKMWKPLLLAKLGDNYRRVSAVFIWTYVKRLFSARDTTVQKEHFGHVSGGYRTVLNRLEELILSHGGTIRTGVSVKSINPCSSGGLWIDSNEGREHFDKVICTSPVNVLQSIASSDLLNVTRSGAEVEYLGVICAALVTRKRLIPYYILNIADQRIPFTGVIGMSNLVSSCELAGYHLTYLPKYVHSENLLLRCSDLELRKLFLDGLSVMFPDLRPHDIESIHINRAMKVQPLQVANYSQLVPQVATKHSDFFVLNTSQFINSSLNNNAVIQSVIEFLRDYGDKFEWRGHEQDRCSPHCS